MKYKEKEVYSSGEIAELLGFSDYHRISNYLKKINATNVTSKGNTRYYDEKTKERVITYFKTLEHKGLGASKKDKLVDELRAQLHQAQNEMTSQLNEQKEAYERLISAKEDTIATLKETVKNLREQQKISNQQIKELTTVTKQAQSLNLADKEPEKIEMLKGNHPKKEETKKQSSNWFTKIFK